VEVGILHSEQGIDPISWGCQIEHETPATFTKDYAVGFTLVDPNIPTVLLNVVGRQTGHSNCIMQSLR
jgi:hypothetical protein